jgi:hypothetical protein
MELDFKPALCALPRSFTAGQTGADDLQFFHLMVESLRQIADLAKPSLQGLERVKTPIIVIFASAALLLILKVVFVYRAFLPNPELIGELFPEVRLLALVAFAAGLGGLLLHHNIQDFHPIVRDSFVTISKDLRKGIENSLGTMNATMAEGFTTMATAFAKEVKGASEKIWEGFSDVRVKEQLISTIQNPRLRKLAKEQRIQEAIADTDDSYMKDQAERQQKISLLLLSNEEKDWSAALEMLDKEESLQKPEHFLTLAFRFWSIKRVDISVTLAERGLKLVKADNTVLISRFQNSLAYYYADAEMPGKESLALEYAEAAVKRRPDEASPLDTLGFVKITYGKTRNDVLEGVKLCTRAFEQGTRFELYAKHVGRANSRLVQLPSS